LIYEDVTERKQLEEQLHLAQRMEALGTLAGGIAHNFNNLLTGIMGNASLMLLNTDPTHPHHERLKAIEKLVDSGSKLTRQLLGYARKGQYEARPPRSLSGAVMGSSRSPSRWGHSPRG